MENFFASLGELRPWHWWALGAILIGVEMMTPTFYFLWPGIAACIVGALLVLTPGITVQTQIFVFAVLAVISTVVWKRFAPESWTSTEPHPTLNNRAAQYQGRRAKAAVDFSSGHGAILIDDTRWSAVTADGSDPKSGDALVVTGADGTVLTVKAG